MLCQGDSLYLTFLLEDSSKSFACLIKHDIFWAHQYPDPLVGLSIRESVQHEGSRLPALRQSNKGKNSISPHLVIPTPPSSEVQLEADIADQFAWGPIHP
jgi:hypothetical protein